MVTYRLAEEKDYININNFYNKIYNSNRTIEQFYWEFHHCPYGKSIYVIAEDGQKIVGTNCVIPIQLTNQSQKTFLTGKSEDTLVDPAYRGQNIFYNIYDFLFLKCKEHGIQIIWGFTSAEKPFKKLGFSVPFRHQQSLAVNGIWKSFKYLSSLNSKNTAIQKFQILGLCIFSKLKYELGNIGSKKNDFKCSKNEDIIHQIDDLIKSNSQKNNNAFYIDQTPNFQNWRVYTNPNYSKIHTYGFYNSKDVLIGLIVLNTNKDSVAYIIQSSFSDVLSQKEKVSMLKHAINDIFSMGISIIRNWHFDTNQINKDEIEIYKAANFIQLKKGIGFVWKEIYPVDLNPNDFFLSRIATQGSI